MELITTTATEVLVNLALGVISLLAAYGMYFIRQAVAKMQMQTAQIAEDAGRKLLTDALSDVESLAIKTVGAIEQTTAAALRKAIKEGKSSREELLKLGDQAFKEVEAAISDDAKEIIEDNLGDFDAYLTKCIEDAVRKVKQEAPYITLDGEVLASSV